MNEKPTASHGHSKRFGIFHRANLCGVGCSDFDKEVVIFI